MCLDELLVAFWGGGRAGKRKHKNTHTEKQANKIHNDATGSKNLNNKEIFQINSGQ